MGWRFILHFDRDGDEPPACLVGNSCAHDFALEAERFGHVDDAKLGNTYGLPIDRELIVGKVEAESIPFLAFEAWKATFLPILAWMLELGERSLLLHGPVVDETLPE